MQLSTKSAASFGAAIFLLTFGFWSLSNAASETKGEIPKTTSQSASAPRSEELNLPGMHNVFRLSEKLISGSVPENEAAFQALQKLGVKTIITVDGARPDVKTAKKYGMRYVQIPFGYDGLPRELSLRLARAVRELPGPIYLHCHHGKHRSPTAAACVMIANEGWSNESALDFLKRAGTGQNYTGLWGDVRHYQAPTDAEIKKAPKKFPAVAPTPPLVQTMVRLDEIVEHLKAAQGAQWNVPTDHPDIDPPHEALILREIYTEMLRERATKRRPADYQKWVAEAEAAGLELETALRAKNSAGADVAFKKITANCGACHAVYRNVPQKGTE